MKRSVKIDLIPPAEMRQKIIASIRNYRLVCRQVYSACAMAKMASAAVVFTSECVRVNPLPNSEAELLTSTFGRNPQRTLTRNDLAPTLLSFVWDSVRREVEARWKSKDPEFQKATRGWLTLNGARDFARFNRIGIACPVATARPKFSEHTLTIKWCHEIGEVEFKIPRLDSGRYFIYKSLRDSAPGWKMGTLYLNERDGRVFATVSFERPDTKADLDPERKINIFFSDDPESFIKIVGPDAQYTYDTISAAEAVAWLNELKFIRSNLETRRAAAGNPRKPWGSAKQWQGVQQRLSNNTDRRTNGVQTRNHLWTRRITERAQSWKCGVVAVNEIPENLFGHPWQWHQFQMFLTYKIEELGGVVIVNNGGKKIF